MNAHPFFFMSTMVVSIALSGCGSASNRDDVNSPDDVASGSNDGSLSDSTRKDQPENDTKAMPHGPKSTNDGNSIPEDYSLTDRDCIELAKHYVVVQKADQMGTLAALYIGEFVSRLGRDGVIRLPVRSEHAFFSLKREFARNGEPVLPPSIDQAACRWNSSSSARS